MTFTLAGVSTNRSGLFTFFYRSCFSLKFYTKPAPMGTNGKPWGTSHNLLASRLVWRMVISHKEFSGSATVFSCFCFFISFGELRNSSP
jgi:hypothetical protein